MARSASAPLHAQDYPSQHKLLFEFEDIETFMLEAHGATRYERCVAPRIEAPSTRSQHPGRRSPATLRRMLACACILQLVVYHRGSKNQNNILKFAGIIISLPIFYVACYVLRHAVLLSITRGNRVGT